jgi:hypothetical protein
MVGRKLKWWLIGFATTVLCGYTLLAAAIYGHGGSKMLPGWLALVWTRYQLTQEFPDAEVVSIDSDSCNYGKWSMYENLLRWCPPRDNNSTPLLVIMNNKNVSSILSAPDARLYSGTDVNHADGVARGWARHPTSLFARLTHNFFKRHVCGGVPKNDGALNIMLTEEGPDFHPFVHDPVGMGRFQFLVTTDPRPLQGYIFHSWGFATLLSRLRKPIMVPSRRMNATSGGLIVWAASHCNSVSKRLQYLQTLSKVVPVHSVGKCWRTYSPAFGKFNGLSSSAQAEWESMGLQYKFWFAAENYLCDSYMTEKMWISLAYGSVPVLYGSKTTHASYAPSNDSFIDVRKFASAADLGLYLLALDADDTAYMAYHAWRHRPLKALNPKFVELMRRSAKNTFLPYPKSNVVLPHRSIPAATWMCRVAEEVSRRRAAPAPRLRSARTDLAAQPICQDPSGLEIHG